MLDTIVRTLTGIRERRRLRGRVVRTLALKSRGAIFNDGLPLRKLANHLEVEWFAREPHPWDEDLPPERRAERFVVESLSDTIVAICRMFDRLPEIDTIRIRVLGPNDPDKTLLAGTVHRADLHTSRRCPSPAMSLKLLGIEYRVVDGSFEPL
jgi:hypothetical protein